MKPLFKELFNTGTQYGITGAIDESIRGYVFQGCRQYIADELVFLRTLYITISDMLNQLLRVVYWVS